VGTVTREEYDFAEEHYYGYCKLCQDFTHESAEIDAENYECPVCGYSTVFGMRSCLLLDLFEIDE